MRWLKALVKGSLALLALTLLAGAVAAVVYRDRPAAEVEARWATPPSRFVSIDGVRLHYRDEGAGPAVVRSDFAQKNAAAIDGYARALKEAEVFAQDPKNFDALLKIINQTFKIDGPAGAAAVEHSLRNAISGARFSYDAKALQHAADYLHKSGRIDKVVDTSRMLQLR